MEFVEGSALLINRGGMAWNSLVMRVGSRGLDFEEYGRCSYFACRSDAVIVKQSQLSD